MTRDSRRFWIGTAVLGALYFALTTAWALGRLG